MAANDKLLELYFERIRRCDEQIQHWMYCKSSVLSQRSHLSTHVAELALYDEHIKACAEQRAMYLQLVGPAAAPAPAPVPVKTEMTLQNYKHYPNCTLFFQISNEDAASGYISIEPDGRYKVQLLIKAWNGGMNVYSSSLEEALEGLFRWLKIDKTTVVYDTQQLSLDQLEPQFSKNVQSLIQP